MERLKGKTILLGKEPGHGRLLVAIQGGKAAAIGAAGSVPNSVSRCKTAEGVAHAKISVDRNGNMTLVNMKPQNVTFVNGSEIMSKRVSTDNTVELGKDRFNVSLKVITETAKQLAGPPPEKAYNISHLEKVWNDFHDRNIEIRKRQKQQGVLASLPMFFTMGGGAISFILSFILGEQYKDEIQVLAGILVVAGLCMLIFSFFKRSSDSSLEELEMNAEDFQDKYVCPNPKCGKFLGNMSYKLMKKQYSMQCPYCKSKFVEN